MLLAFDTATPFVTVALHDGGRMSGVVLAEARSEARMKHGEQLAPLIERVLAEAGATREDLTAIAVGTGPGPFTGLRVGLVTARGLALVLGVPVHGVCTLDAIALEAARVLTADDAEPGGFVVATDARRQEVYLASYDAHGRRLSGPVVDRPGAVATLLPVAGEGGALYPDDFPHAVGPTWPSAGWLARAAAEGTAELTEPDPRYLRRPDAVAPGAPKRVS